MTRIQLPFWLVTDWVDLPAKRAELQTNRAYVFTSEEKATAFLAARKSICWTIETVSDKESVILAAANLHKHRLPEIPLNPGPNLSGGETVHLADLMKLAY